MRNNKLALGMFLCGFLIVRLVTAQELCADIDCCELCCDEAEALFEGSSGSQDFRDDRCKSSCRGDNDEAFCDTLSANGNGRESCQIGFSFLNAQDEPVLFEGNAATPDTLLCCLDSGLLPDPDNGVCVTPAPTISPTANPTVIPTISPTKKPTVSPTTSIPSISPAVSPTKRPTLACQTAVPSEPRIRRTFLIGFGNGVIVTLLLGTCALHYRKSKELKAVSQQVANLA